MKALLEYLQSGHIDKTSIYKKKERDRYNSDDYVKLCYKKQEDEDVIFIHKILDRISSTTFYCEYWYSFRPNTNHMLGYNEAPYEVISGASFEFDDRYFKELEINKEDIKVIKQIENYLDERPELRITKGQKKGKYKIGYLSEQYNFCPYKEPKKI